MTLYLQSSILKELCKTQIQHINLAFLCNKIPLKMTCYHSRPIKHFYKNFITKMIFIQMLMLKICDSFIKYVCHLSVLIQSLQQFQNKIQVRFDAKVCISQYGTPILNAKKLFSGRTCGNKVGKLWSDTSNNLR